MDTIINSSFKKGMFPDEFKIANVSHPFLRMTEISIRRTIRNNHTEFLGKGVLKMKTPMPKCDSNKVAKATLLK